MSIIDASMNIPGNSGPAADEEFVLSHCDALESSGFVEHSSYHTMSPSSRPWIACVSAAWHN
jgi:alpha-D-ribose 1-methylphosphonate 5-triphosphate synthase subunit PhnI